MDPFTVLDNIFKNCLRKDSIKNIVLHETCGSSATGCVSTLKRRGIGVHFIVDYNGEIIQCVDPLLRTDHAKGVNNKAIGIEIVNPYAPKNIYRNSELPYNYTPAQWWTWCPDKDDRRYVLPFPIQLKNTVLLVDYLCKNYAVKLEFPTIKAHKKIPAEQVGLGIVAHRDFGTHSDGRYPLEYVYRNAQLRENGVLSAVY